MPRWVSAAEISKHFSVGAAKLLEFSARGNLACRQAAGGVLFDLDHAARLFRPRAAADGGNEPSRLVAGFGTLGEIKLGERWVPGPDDQQD